MGNNIEGWELPCALIWGTLEAEAWRSERVGSKGHDGVSLIEDNKKIAIVQTRRNSDIE